jgi:glycosyltransferase involved in cell wall biosynthesis
MKKFKIVRTSTIAASLDILLKGQLDYLNQYFEVIAVSGLDKHLENVYLRENVKITDVKFRRKISPLFDLLSLYKLYRLFLKEKPILVHSITPKAGLITMMAGKLACVPIRIHTFTGLVFPSKSGILKKLLILMDKLLCYCSTHIIPEGCGVRNNLIEYNITNKPLNVLANGSVNGVDINYFNPHLYNDVFKSDLRNQLGIKIDDFVFIYVGRLVSDKGINELINAFTTLNFQNDSFKAKLLLVGNYENEYDPLHPATLNEISNNKQIIEVGFQNDVRPYFAISNCLAFPSYREGFPNVVIQAGCMGLPSIVTDINGCNEIIINKFNGLIIPPKNITKLIDAMLRMIEINNEYLQYKNNARQNIIDKYEQNLVLKSILNEYNSIIYNANQNNLIST